MTKRIKYLQNYNHLKETLKEINFTPNSNKEAKSKELFREEE